MSGCVVILRLFFFFKLDEQSMESINEESRKRQSIPDNVGDGVFLSFFFLLFLLNLQERRGPGETFLCGFLKTDVANWLVGFPKYTHDIHNKMGRMSVLCRHGARFLGGPPSGNIRRRKCHIFKKIKFSSLCF